MAMIRLGFFVLAGSAAALFAYEFGAGRRFFAEPTPTTGHAEAFRLQQISHERERADLARACLNRRADQMASTGTMNREGAVAVFEACRPAFMTYALSLIAMSPTPIYAEAPDLVARWKPYYVQAVLDRITETRGMPPDGDPARDISL